MPVLLPQQQFDYALVVKAERIILMVNNLVFATIELVGLRTQIPKRAAIETLWLAACAAIVLPKNPNILILGAGIGGNLWNVFHTLPTWKKAKYTLVDYCPEELFWEATKNTCDPEYIQFCKVHDGSFKHDSDAKGGFDLMIILLFMRCDSSPKARKSTSRTCIIIMSCSFRIR